MHRNGVVRDSRKHTSFPDHPSFRSPPLQPSAPFFLLLPPRAGLSAPVAIAVSARIMADPSQGANGPNMLGNGYQPTHFDLASFQQQQQQAQAQHLQQQQQLRPQSGQGPIGGGVTDKDLWTQLEAQFRAGQQPPGTLTSPVSFFSLSSLTQALGGEMGLVQHSFELRRRAVQYKKVRY